MGERVPSSANQRRQQLKQKYGKLYDELARLLAEDDPMGLVSSGAPPNEYEPEIDAILSQLHEATTPDALGHLLYETFARYFGAAFASPDMSSAKPTKEQFAALGQKAWRLWKRWEAEAH
ncbi:hypothetical protein EPA93_19930 [Ktedonosporobacter rubrisoli]|uniref:Uncharacterized protein n=1 Tax=Ktedonosporobacter rubrisoli TaxID=2509675 RepID=A0A4P6JS42_KTERU|nr:hypothetical protein [Ktedonosporobacter rubrisoli]QBD78143.1 hypothetical protein EPA93_19930 [Ktedonosporobacter rubrisoli]